MPYVDRVYPCTRRVAFGTDSPHQIDAIRDRVDIAEVIGRHVRLTRKGVAMWVMPVHQEKTPSFNVVTAKGFITVLDVMLAAMFFVS